jgi:hypothetical protein
MSFFIQKFQQGSPEKAFQKVKMSVQFAESRGTGQGRGMTTHFAHGINMRAVKMHKHRLHPDVLQPGIEQQAVVFRLRNSETHSTDSDKCASGRKTEKLQKTC